MKPLKILSLPVDKGGCGWYRIRQPFHMIKEYSEHDAHVIDKETDDMLEIAEALSICDVLVIRQGGEKGLDLLRETVDLYGKEIGKPKAITAKIVLDIDDNVELISPYSEHYKEYGTKDFFDPGIKKWVWKDGEGGFDSTNNRWRIMSLMKAMREVDLITVTTEKLAEYAKQYNSSVAILPNSIDFDKWWKLPFKSNTQPRVGWSGGISHYEDWYQIKAPLNRLLRKYRFKLIVIGAHFSGLIDKDLRHLVEVYPWVPFEAHSYRMMCMNLDVAVVPLADLPFNSYKSSIKFQEFAAMGIPTLISNITPYKEEVTPFLNGMIYHSEEEFETNLERLLIDQTLREELTYFSQLGAWENFNAQTNAKLWIDAYQQLTNS